MANRVVFQQKIFPEYIDKFKECLRLENESLSITGSTINNGELLEKMIEEYYFRLQGKTNDADTVNKINQFIDDGIESRIANVEMKIDSISFNELRTNKLLETFMRIAIGSKEERIRAKMLSDNLTREQAEKQYEEWEVRIFEEPSQIVEAVDTLLYDDENTI